MSKLEVMVNTIYAIQVAALEANMDRRDISVQDYMRARRIANAEARRKLRKPQAHNRAKPMTTEAGTV